jgi:hypothetical protein
MLMNHADSHTYRIGGGAEHVRRSIDNNFALVGFVHAVELPHEGALSRTIFAEERMDFAGPNVETDAIIRHHARKALHDIEQLDVLYPRRRYFN